MAVSEGASALAALTGTKPGYVPFAYALAPDEHGRYVAVELKRVRFEDAVVGEGCVLGKLEAEPRATALKRIIQWATKRTMRDHSGWFSAYRLRGGS